MKKQLKIIIIAILIAIMMIIGFFVNGIYGNPVSKKIADNVAKKYISDTYTDESFTVDAAVYNFKDGYYHVNAQSKYSMDTYFTVAVNGNKVVYDSYSDDVLTGWNTYLRIDAAYRKLADKVLESPHFPIESDLHFGTINLLEENSNPDFGEPDFGVQLSELELDKVYDIELLGKEVGHIIFYAQDEDVSFERASHLLLQLKEQFDDADIPFYAVDFVLQKPREESATNKDEFEINILHMLYADIYEEGLVERVKQSHEETMAYYGEQDAQFKEEIE